MTMKRRDAIKTFGALAGAATAPGLLSGCGSDEVPGEQGITTVVFLLMENRSYDHYLGARSLLEGLPGDGMTAAMSNPDLAGNPVPIAPAGDGDMCSLDPPHGWDPSRVQLNGGMNDGFVIAHQTAHESASATEPMRYLARDRLPIHYALADAYTSCDRWFCSVLGPTLPNRMYWHAGTSNGAQDNPSVIGGAYEGVPTLYHRLDAAGVDWAYYYHDVALLGVLKGDLDVTGRIRIFADEFFADAAAGRLPPVVYIDPAFTFNDDHPPHHPMLGQQLIAAIYQALAISPQWKNCLLVVTYDEHGGFYDHVAPPSSAADDHAEAGFDQLGFRVPALVIGPYAKQSHVSSVVYDHTSALKHVEDMFSLDPLSARSSAANSLLDCIDLERLEAGLPRDPILLPATELDHIPPGCAGGVPRSGRYHHDILAWADLRPDIFGPWDRRRHARDDVYGIAEYLDHHNLGRIRRR